MFRSAFNRGDQRYTSDPGRRIRDKMSVVVNKEGAKVLEKVGETDFYAYIQSFKDSVDLKQIVERCAMSGDMSLLQRAQGVFGDYVGFPKDLRSCEDLRIATEGAYNALSDEQKAQISFEQFLEGFSSEEKFNALQSVLNPSPDPGAGSEGEVV